MWESLQTPFKINIKLTKASKEASQGLSPMPLKRDSQFNEQKVNGKRDMTI